MYESPAPSVSVGSETVAGNQILSDCSGEIIAIDYGKFPSWGIFL
jgi:hypothetical protein